uniref:Uncharacterized protein n=1 Tax=Tanacetum cinerariifolium TaxID=118510 RepID=A0A6L2P3C6_TANCI|nr:hypothetical protein [Tanacetum cinerariifolium]
MATLQFADTHNMVVFLSKPTESDGFEQIVDFMNAHPLRYAFTVNPIIYISCIEQFWSTAMTKTINGEAQLHGKVDGKKIIIIESFVRRDLRLADEEGIDCLSSSTIFEQIALIGHIELLELLLSVCVDVDSPSNSGTPLVWAAGHSQQDVVKLLLEYKANGIETQMGQGLKFNEAANAFYKGVKLEPENIELESTRSGYSELNRTILEELFRSNVEIVDPKTRDETSVTIFVDDGIRLGTTLADLAKLKLVFKKNRLTTAGT